VNFKDAKRRAIEALRSGDFQHEARNDIDDKNLLVTGRITAEQVVTLLNRCRGTQHASSPHHQDASIEVHVFKPVARAADGTQTRWYIKLYFLDPDTWFISVHQI
jgi:hypothetical protein